MKYSVLLFIILFGFNSFAKDSCAVCDEHRKFASKLSKVKPDAFDPQTAAYQDELVLEGSRLAIKILNEKNLQEREARVLVELLISMIPYDNSLIAVQDNIVAFKRHYAQGAAIKSAISKLIAEKKITAAHRDKLLDWYGIRPSK